MRFSVLELSLNHLQGSDLAILPDPEIFYSCLTEKKVVFLFTLSNEEISFLTSKSFINKASFLQKITIYDFNKLRYLYL